MAQKTRLSAPQRSGEGNHCRNVSLNQSLEALLLPGLRVSVYLLVAEAQRCEGEASTAQTRGEATQLIERGRALVEAANHLSSQIARLRQTGGVRCHASGEAKNGVGAT